MVGNCEGFCSICRFSNMCYQAWSFCNHRIKWFNLLKAISHHQLQCVCNAGNMLSYHNALHVLLSAFQAVIVFLSRWVFLIFDILMWQFFLPRQWQCLDHIYCVVSDNRQDFLSDVIGDSVTQMLPEYRQLCGSPWSSCKQELLCEGSSCQCSG